MSLNYDKTLIPLARKLRGEMSPRQKHLWYDFLSGLPVRFQRKKTISGYVVDFYCHKAKLVVEIDEGYGGAAADPSYDKITDDAIRALGLRVARFSGADVDKRFDAVCADILTLAL